MRELLPLLPRPSRYAGIEDNVCRKDPTRVRLRVALAFPDTYEVGMSYLGQKILYGVVNARPQWWAERVMAPEREAAQVLREHNAPLATLESDTPLVRTHALCFSITHELCYTNVLYMLDLAGIPLRSADRPESLDALSAGDGRRRGPAQRRAPDPICGFDGSGRRRRKPAGRAGTAGKSPRPGWTRKELLHAARRIPGVYVPSLFTPVSAAPGAPLRPLVADYARPARRIVADINKAAYPVRQVVPVGPCTTGSRWKSPAAARADAASATPAWSIALCESAPWKIFTACCAAAWTKQALTKFPSSL